MTDMQSLLALNPLKSTLTYLLKRFPRRAHLLTIDLEKLCAEKEIQHLKVLD